MFALTNDPQRLLAIPGRDSLIPHLDVAALESTSDRLIRAQRYHRALARAMETSSPQFAIVNTELVQSERKLLNEAGLPNRSWYRHLLYAPGFYTGHGGKAILCV